MVLNTNVVAGMIEPDAFRGTQKLDKATNITITRGDIMNRATATTPDSYQTCPVGGVGPFAYAMETVTAAQAKSKVSAITYETEVYVTADGAIEPGSYVQRSGTTAGRVIVWDGTTANIRCGEYIGHAGEADGGVARTPAALNDVIKIRFTPNGG
jgi:hypothetical protein